MFRKPQIIAASIVLVLVLTALSIPRETSARLKLALSSLFLPLFGLASSAPPAAQRTGDAVVPRSVLIGELNRLKKENAELHLRATEAEALRQENDRLRTYVGWRPFSPGKYKLARVIGRDPANWWRTVRIDLGSRDGLTPNLAVITPAGLVGRTGSVGVTHADVLLVGDPNCRVAAIVSETKDHGVVQPSASALDASIVDLTYLAKASTIKPGNRVVTSGIGGIFPRNITIGEIVDLHSVGYGLYTEARVRLTVNYNQLEDVWVVLP
ncbi:MAG: rod shape-determining protein MreC [Verrucomicrobia bacterium]|nr:rod shape-determining protein MreC [Verrucomicrobiota bacterium]